jgi:DNA-binding transcriptional ArsR family regulator
MLNDSRQLDRAFAALADPVRRGMLARLSRGPASVSELAAPFPMSLPAVLQHLKALETSGLVASHKQGRVRTVRLEPDVLSAAEHWLFTRREEWEARLNRFEAHLHDIQQEEQK